VAAAIVETAVTAATADTDGDERLLAFGFWLLAFGSFYLTALSQLFGFGIDC
jgi:hypothetical protein